MSDFVEEAKKNWGGANISYSDLQDKINRLRTKNIHLQSEVKRLTQGIKDIGEECARRQDKILMLKEQLKAANRRANAAVEDIKSLEIGEQSFPPDVCPICTKSHISCSTGGSACKGFKWRGEQEGEEG